MVEFVIEWAPPPTVTTASTTITLETGESYNFGVNWDNTVFARTTTAPILINGLFQNGLQAVNVLQAPVIVGRRPTELAIRRARHLLEELLGPREYAAVQSQEGLRIPSRLHPGRVYTISTRFNGIKVHDDGEYRGYICLEHSYYDGPWAEEDLALTRVFTTRYQEEELEAIGNWHGGAHPFVTFPPLQEAAAA